MTREVFVAGQILTAAEMNVVSDQTVMSFAGTAARGSAIPSPVEGMTTYLEDSNILSIYDGSAWKTSLGVTGGILQVVSTTKTDIFSTTSTSYVDVTGLSATITPRSTSSRVLVLVSTMGRHSGNGVTSYSQLVRDATNVFIGDAAGSRVRASKSGEAVNTASVNHDMTFVDSPATVAAVTYKVQVRVDVNGPLVLNESSDGSDATTTGRFASSITLIEVAG